MHWHKWLLVSFLLFSTYRSDGQQIDLGVGDIDFLQLPFNQEFIRRNRIVRITVEEQNKRSNQPIRFSGTRKSYDFDGKGRCSARSTYRERYGRNDTIFEVFNISPADQVTRYDRKDNAGFYRETFKRSGDTLTTCTYRGYGQDSAVTWIACEHRVTKRFELREEERVLNENGLPYLNLIRTYDAAGYLLKSEEEYVISRKKRTTEFSYNDYGRLQFRRRTTEKGTEEWSFEYDEQGMLSEVFYRVDGALVWRRAIVPDDYGRIAAVLTLDPKTEDITIEKFTYETQP